MASGLLEMVVGKGHFWALKGGLLPTGSLHPLSARGRPRRQQPRLICKAAKPVLLLEGGMGCPFLPDAPHPVAWRGHLCSNYSGTVLRTKAA